MDDLRERVQGSGCRIETYRDERAFLAAGSRAGAEPRDLERAQGVFAVMKQAPYLSGDELLELGQGQPNALILVLDSVTDPQNLGAVLRSAAFFGATGVVVGERRSVSLTPAAIKVSAGGFAYVPLAQVKNIAQFLQAAKEKDFWIYGLSEHARDSIGTVDFTTPTVLVVGNEEKGMRDLVSKRCDQLLQITPAGDFVSLNAATAASVAMGLVRFKQKS